MCNMCQTIKLTTLKKYLGWDNLEILEPEYGYINSFSVYTKEKPTFVAPFFSLRYGNLDNRPNILLISAVGAAGKTQLSEFMSHETGAPILDLAKHEPVGGYSFTGLLSRRYVYSDITSRIADGKQLFIIDGLDEGLMQATREGFFSFIDDMIRFAKEAKNTSIVLLGRTLIMEEVALYLEENDCIAPLLRIEPFTEEQAKEFLYKKVIGEHRERFTQPYRDIVQHLIGSIKGFFKNQGEFDRATYDNFIGYAPVLDAIAELLRGNLNYHALLHELETDNLTNVNLLIQLVEKILIREQIKIKDAVTSNLLNDYPLEQRGIFEKEVYSKEDQCFRLLSICINKDVPTIYNGDETFSYRFDRQLGDMRYEHPFLKERRINNVVFEAYVLAQLASSGSTYLLVLEYMKQKKLFKNSFAFYPIFMNIMKDKDIIISDDFFPALYNSLCSQSSSILKTSVNIDQDDNDETKLNITFENREYDIEDDISMFMHDADNFTIGATLGNAVITGDFDITISGKQVAFTAPIIIDCRTFTAKCSELSLCHIYDQEMGVKDNIEIICNNFSVLVDEQGYITNLKQNDSNLQIRSVNKPMYPFSQFYKGKAIDKSDPDYLKFQKLSRIILQFRGHGKGALAKKKDKIVNRNSYGVGRETVKALVDAGIIYEKGHLYVINEERFMDILGLSYDNMINGIINDKVRSFLCSY